jgi:O-glycosyl hydrolase
MKRIAGIVFFMLSIMSTCVTSCKKSIPTPPPIPPTDTTQTGTSGGTIDVNIASPQQKIDLMGAGCYFYSGHIKNIANYTDATNWLWNDLNVNAFRIVLRNGGVEDVNDNADPAITDFSKFNFGANTNNTDQISQAKRALALKPGIKIWAIVLSPPKFLKTNNNVNNGGTLNTTVSNSYEEFGESTYAHLKNLKDSGITVNYLSLMNEPDFASSTIPYESADFTVSLAQNVYTTTVNWLKNKLPGQGITVPIFTGPDCISTSSTSYLSALDNTGNVGLFAMHQYSNSSVAAFRTASTLAGAKGVYMSEGHAGFGLGNTPDELTAALNLVTKFHDVFRGGAKGYLYFEWGAPTVNFGGLLFTPFGANAERKKNYFIYKQFSDSLLQSNYAATAITGSGNIVADNVSAFVKQNSASLNVLNSSASAQKNVRLNFGINIKNVRVYRTSPTENNTLVTSKDNVNQTYIDVDFVSSSFTTVRVTW